MSPIIVSLIGLGVLFALLLCGLPVGVGMAVVGFGGIWYLISGSAAMAKFAFVPFTTVCSYDLAVLPLFLLMAYVTFASGITKDLYNLAAKWLGFLPGGLAMATVGGCAGFAAISGSSVASAATMGLVALPEMKRFNYDPALATGCVAAGGTMGILIPPSEGLILYGIITGTSIGRLFMAGIVPGVLEAIFYMLVIYTLCRWKPHYGPPGPSYSFKEKVMAFSSCGELVVLVALVLGGLFIGWFTPTEAGAVGAFGAIIISTVRKRLNWQKFKQAVLNTMQTTGMIYCILIGAFVFNYFLGVTNMPTALADFVSGLPLPPLGIMAIVMLVYIFLGAIMDTGAMMLLTIPIFFPLAISLGFDPLWFGIIQVRMAEIGMVTPPIGVNVFVIAGTAKDVPITTIFKGILPFLFADLVHVTLLLLVPSIVLFLPNLMW